jgi:hypothetical protein
MTLVASGQAKSFGEAKAACELRGGAGSSVGGAQTSAEGLSLPVHINGGRTHGSHALSLRVRSKRPWPAASVGFTNGG